jgi:nucleotide-binding universal stress UspA family protein
MKTIVVGYDESSPSTRALDRAADFAEAFGAQLIVTSVAPVLVGVSGGMGAVDPTDPVERHVAELARAREHLSGRKVRVATRAAIGEPAESIVALAEETEADLIVVGTRHLNLVERLLGQSVSQAVSRQAHCDVLIVH